MNCMNSGDGLTPRRKTKTKEIAKLGNTGQVSRFKYVQTSQEDNHWVKNKQTNKQTRFMK